MGPSPQYLAAKISYIRKITVGKNYTQFAHEITQLSQKTTSRGALIRWERGETVPHLDYLIAISRIGLTSLDDLLAPDDQLASNLVAPELIQGTRRTTDELPAKINQIKDFLALNSITEFSQAIEERFGYQISSTRLGYWLKGTHLPNALFLYPIAHMGGITVDELLASPYPLELE